MGVGTGLAGQRQHCGASQGGGSIAEHPVAAAASRGSRHSSDHRLDLGTLHTHDSMCWASSVLIINLLPLGYHVFCIKCMLILEMRRKNKTWKQNCKIKRRRALCKQKEVDHIFIPLIQGGQGHLNYAKLISSLVKGN